MRSQLSSGQTKVLVLGLLVAILAMGTAAAFIILRAQNDPESRARIERLEAIRDSAQAVQDSLADARRLGR